MSGRRTCFDSTIGSHYYTNLPRYLELEQILNEFFDLVNFCRPNCLNHEISLYEPDDGSETVGPIACCSDDFFLLDKKKVKNPILTQIILERYGPPINKNNCSYHQVDSGCVLKDHKPPTCISFICPTYTTVLSEKFGINYNWENVRNRLSYVLDGIISESEYKEFKTDILTATLRVQTINISGVKPTGYVHLPTWTKTRLNLFD